MRDGEMVATNSIIDINPHDEMVKWWNFEMVWLLNGTIMKWWNGEFTIDKWRYGETTRTFLSTIKWVYLPVLTQVFPYFIS